jgi:hypothetical protein
VSADDILEFFYKTFKGNNSFFVKHQAPFTEKEGKTKATWCGLAVYNKHTPPPEGKEDGDFIPLTIEQYREHLNGGNGLAISPLTNTKYKKNVCFYAVIDIDVYGVDFTWLVNRLYHAGFKFAAFLSKSGGLHIYFFFDDPEPGDEAVAALKRVVEVFGLRRLFVSKDNKSKVEIFPKQAAFSSGSTVGNCLFLPFYNTANKSRQNMLTAEGHLVGITKAAPVIKRMVTSVDEVTAVLDGLPHNDAPYCVQMVLLTGALAENDGRNNFLFSAAIYLKKKYKEDFKETLQEMNDCLESSLEQRDLDNIYTSVTTKGYDNYSCKKSPCADYCDKKLCALREYGIGKQRNNRFTGADCWGELSKVMVKEPYYVWKVRVREDEEFKELRVDSVDDLHNQAAMQKYCLRYLNWAPLRVKDNDWIATLNTAMEGIDERQIEVPEETDTTEMVELHNLFVQYLTHSRIQNGQPSMIEAGQVYYADGIYYFKTKGIMSFLRFQKFSLQKTNLHAELTAYGCSDGELSYRTVKGVEKVIKCWIKPEDDELLETADLYEDVYDSDAETARNITLDKEGKKESGDEGVKF